MNQAASIKRKLRYLRAPSSPHIVITSNGLAFTHKAKVHGGTNQVAVESQIHTTHGEQCALRDGQECIHIPKETNVTDQRTKLKMPLDQCCSKNVPSVPLKGLDKLGGCIVIRDIEPQTMGDRSRNTLTEAERVSTDEVNPFTIWVI